MPPAGICAKWFLRNKNIYNSYDKKSFPYIMPKKRSVDIDSIDDFNYAKYLLFKNSLKK